MCIQIFRRSKETALNLYFTHNNNIRRSRLLIGQTNVISHIVQFRRVGGYRRNNRNVRITVKKIFNVFRPQIGIDTEAHRHTDRSAAIAQHIGVFDGCRIHAVNNVGYLFGAFQNLFAIFGQVGTAGIAVQQFQA